MPEAELQSVAWVLRGITGADSAGLLRLSDERLALIGQDGPAFDVPVDDVSDVSFPWFYFSGGMKLTAAREKYRRAANEIVPGAGLVAVADIAGDIRKGRSAGKEWKRLLG